MNDYRAYVEKDYNSIYHHGVKGQKWGHRKYQNADGSLTPEGRQRYLTLNTRGRWRYGVPNSAALAMAGGTVSGVALADAAVNRNIAHYARQVDNLSYSKYLNRPAHNKFNNISKRSLSRARRSVKLAIAAAGVTSIAVVANEVRKKRIMQRLHGPIQQDNEPNKQR